MVITEQVPGGTACCGYLLQTVPHARASEKKPALAARGLRQPGLPPNAFARSPATEPPQAFSHPQELWLLARMRTTVQILKVEVNPATPVAKTVTGWKAHAEGIAKALSGRDARCLLSPGVGDVPARGPWDDLLAQAAERLPLLRQVERVAKEMKGRCAAACLSRRGLQLQLNLHIAQGDGGGARQRRKVHRWGHAFCTDLKLNGPCRASIFSGFSPNGGKLSSALAKPPCPLEEHRKKPGRIGRGEEMRHQVAVSPQLQWIASRG